MFSFKALTSKTILGALVAVVVYLANAYAGDQSLSAEEIGGAVAILLTALGLRDAIAKNGAGR